MKKRLDIIEVETRKSKTGKDYRVCQCIVHDTEGKKRVGELMVFRPELELKEGSFIAEFEITVNWERMVGAELKRMHWIGGADIVTAVFCARDLLRFDVGMQKGSFMWLSSSEDCFWFSGEGG